MPFFLNKYNKRKLQHIYWKNNCNFCIIVQQNGLGLILEGTIKIKIPAIHTWESSIWVNPSNFFFENATDFAKKWFENATVIKKMRITSIHSTFLFHHKIHSHVVPIALPSTITNAILKHIRHFFYYDKINILSMYYIYCVYYNIEIDFLFGYLLTKRYWYMKI